MQTERLKKGVWSTIGTYLIVFILVGTFAMIIKSAVTFSHSVLNQPQSVYGGGVSPNTQVGATTVKVGTFYDGQEGYSVSIPSGNTSTCIWNYTGGSAAIPGTETTSARTASEKHAVYIYDLYAWKVSCIDDLGNQYVGVFPEKH